MADIPATIFHQTKGTISREGILARHVLRKFAAAAVHVARAYCTLL